MAKIHPVLENARILPDTQRAKDFLNGLKGEVVRQLTDRAEWYERKSHYQRRRYGLEMRNPTFPWPGSSDIVLPLIDKKIDELKPAFVQLVNGVHPPVTVHAITPASQAKSAGVEMWFDWLINFASPNFVRETTLCADDVLETGIGIMKSMWFWETSHSPDTLDFDRLPANLKRLVVTPLNAQQADAAQAAMSARGVDAAILTKKDFDRNQDQIRLMVQREYDLDSEEPKDKTALRDIMAWFRGGATKPLTVMKRDTIRDVPGAVAVSPIDLIVPATATIDLEDAESITHVMHMPIGQIRRAAKDGSWNQDAVTRLEREMQKGAQNKRRQGGVGLSVSRFSDRDEYVEDNALREGVDRRDDTTVEVWETCTWFGERDSIQDRKVVCLYSPAMPDTPFKMFVYNRPSGLWPYHSTFFEVNKRRWHSARGVPEKLDDLDQEVTFQHRNKLNRMAIGNAPTFLYRQRVGVNPSNFRWIPGQFMGVNDPQRDVVPVTIPNVQFSEEREEQILRTWSEDYLGGADHGISDPLGRLSEPRTATEIQAIQGKSRRSLTLRGMVWQQMLKGVYREWFDMWQVFGPQEIWARVTGDEQPIKLTKEDLQGQYEFTPTGTIGEQDPQMEAAKSQARISMLMEIAQTGLMEPKFELNLGEAVRDWMEKDDVRLMRRVLRERSEEEVQQIVQEQQRKAKLMEDAQANVPQDVPELLEALQQIKAGAPHGGRQRVKTGGQNGT